jgi:hypothetical protein
MNGDPSGTQSGCPVKQSVKQKSQDTVNKLRPKFNRLPPMVTPNKIWRLRHSLAEVAEGKALLLQGGDCDEILDCCNEVPLIPRSSCCRRCHSRSSEEATSQLRHHAGDGLLQKSHGALQSIEVRDKCFPCEL